jgi:hypothetical protein
MCQDSILIIGVIIHCAGQPRWHRLCGHLVRQRSKRAKDEAELTGIGTNLDSDELHTVKMESPQIKYCEGRCLPCGNLQRAVMER